MVIVRNEKIPMQCYDTLRRVEELCSTFFNVDFILRCTYILQAASEFARGRARRSVRTRTYLRERMFYTIANTNGKKNEREAKKISNTTPSFATFAIDTTRILDRFNCDVVRKIFNNEVNKWWIIICFTGDDMLSAFSGTFL